ncbi:MAG: GlxA family transcriptional regulator [Planctomycetota bacterium]|jgi:transcriptional regulator GlxA family with amidase domain
MLEMPKYLFPAVTRIPKLRSAERRRRVVFVASRNPDPLELIGPMNVLKIANWVLEHSDRPEIGYDLEVVVSEHELVFEMDGLEIRGNKPYQRLRGRVDTLLFSPMEFEDLFERQNKFLRWVAQMSQRVRRIGTICFATYILAEAGVLDGRRATTHWDLQQDFLKRYPKVNLDVEPIFVKDGPIYTAAGATSAIDMMLALIEEDFGKEVALRTAQALVLFLKRPGNQAQFSVQMSARMPDTPSIVELQSWIYENLDQDLRVERLAERMGMSTRNFARVFAREVGVAPGRFVEQCRLEMARQWLEDTDSPVAEVANRCGYDTPDGLRLAFERHLGISPRAYRQRFSTTRAG